MKPALQHMPWHSVLLAVWLVCPVVASSAPPRPEPIAPPPLAQVQQARDRGLAFLYSIQQAHGEWGSPLKTKGLNVAAEVPGAHHAFTVATTALAIEAICLAAPESPAKIAALDKAETWLLGFLPRLKRPNDIELYNTWAHSYAIRALLLLSTRHADQPTRVSQLRDAAQTQIQQLENYAFLNGGWGYYNFDLPTRTPTGSPTSFTTATALLALHQAQSAGLTVSSKMTDKALQCLLMQRFPDGAYAYSFAHRMRPRLPINRPAGSLGRAPACNAALRVWTGTKQVSDDNIKTWLDRLITRGGWLELSRKRPIPHEAWFQNSGYFYYYGQYYAAICTEMLPATDQPFYQAHFIHGLLRLQERDGSWWDYPLYDYHQAYGTAYALSALARWAPNLKNP